MASGDERRVVTLLEAWPSGAAWTGPRDGRADLGEPTSLACTPL
jgi:hypothetical protein